jgi:DNA-binding NarL/FixJ family response regulator
MGLIRTDSVNFFVKVRALLIIEDKDVKRDVTAALATKFSRGDIVEANSVEAAAKLIKEDKFDIILADSHIATFFFARFCKEVRVGRLGPHPFPIVFILVSQPDPDLIRKVVDCGPDDILLLPLQPGQIESRLEILGKSRKPFVVTRNYTGPNRRTKPREGAEIIPEVPVPNPLAARIKRVSELTLQREIDAARKRLTTLRVRRYGVQLLWLAGAITEAINRIGGTDAKVLGFCQEILDTLDLVKKASRALERRCLVELLETLAATASGIQTARGDFDVRLLTDLRVGSKKIADEINRLFPDGAETAAR